MNNDIIFLVQSRVLKTAKKDLGRKLGDKTIRVCIFGTYRSNYTRHQVLMARMKQAGMEVLECHEDLWMNDEERVQAASGGWLRIGFLWRVLQTYLRLIKKYFSQVSEYDVMVIGYPGTFDVFIGRLLTWFRRKPLVWDIYLSIYLVSLERGLNQKSRFTFACLHWAEKTSSRLPDRLLLETNAYIVWYSNHYRLPKERFRWAPLGADDSFVQQTAQLVSRQNDHLVLFYGTFHPNSGILHIVEAARLLHNYPNIRFELIGKGPDLPEVHRLVGKYRLQNVLLVDWMEKTILVEKISQADLCLGSFGTTQQSFISVHNKIYESMAMGKAVITGDSPAVREAMQHEVHIYLVERGNPQAIADAILKLIDDVSLREKLAANGFDLFTSRFTNQILGAQLNEYFNDLMIGRNRAES